MRQHPRNPVQPLDPAMVERLLDGTVPEDDVPPEYRDVVRALSAAAAPAPALPSAEAAAVAAFRSARRPVDPPRRTSVLSKLLGAKAVAALVLGTATVGTAAAAATGSLPDAAQAKAHSVISAVPEAGAGAHAAGAVKAAGASSTARTGGASGHATLPGALGLCQAYGSGSGAGHGGRLDSTAFGRLAEAAGGTDKIDAYCATVAAAASRAAGSAASGDRENLAGACRAWLAADRAGHAAAATVLDRLTTAAGGADAIAPYCAALVSKDNGNGAGSSNRPSAAPSAPPATPQGNAPTAPPGKGHEKGSPSHPAHPTPRG